MPAAASHPLQLPAAAWRRVVRRTVTEFLDDRLFQWAGALAFFAMVSLFPSLLALVGVLGLVGSDALTPLIQNVASLAPGTARDITLDALRAIQASDRAGFALITGFVVALWSSSAYVGAFIPAANVVWEVEDERPLKRKLVVRIALTLLMLLLIALIALSVVLTGPLAREVGRAVGLGQTAVDVWQVAKWPALALAFVGLLAILYWTAPNTGHPGWRWVVPGAVLAVVLWVVASLGFTFYAANFGSYNATYGSIGGVVVFLLWLWLTNVSILLGAELNAELSRARDEERKGEGDDATDAA